jgi:lysophospholipase L1-like esterase
MRQRLKTGCLGSILVLIVLAVAGTAFVYFQAQRTPAGRATYVALGSSFAAGAGLGELQDDSPLLCARSVNGYPQHLARKLKLPIIDMTCGGATTEHVLRGGHFFQGPQVRAIGSETRLVTITIGGNDLGYVGDLQMLAARNSDTSFGWLVRRLWIGPRQPMGRDTARLETELLATLRSIHEQAPKATIVVATYPTILPASGTCPRIRLSSAEADLMRRVGDRLAASTRSAARRGGAVLVDMHVVGTGHDACSATPWVRGYTNGGIAPFHPTLAGAQATATEIGKALAQAPVAASPSAIAPSGPARAPSAGAATKSGSSAISAAWPNPARLDSIRSRIFGRM